LKKKIVIKRKSFEEFLRSQINDFDEIVEAVVYDSNQFGVILKKGRVLSEATLKNLRDNLSKRYKLTVEDEPDVEDKRKLEKQIQKEEQ